MKTAFLTLVLLLTTQARALDDASIATGSYHIFVTRALAEPVERINQALVIKEDGKAELVISEFAEKVSQPVLDKIAEEHTLGLEKQGYYLVRTCEGSYETDTVLQKTTIRFKDCLVVPSMAGQNVLQMPLERDLGKLDTQFVVEGPVLRGALGCELTETQSGDQMSFPDKYEKKIPPNPYRHSCLLVRR